MGSNTYWKDLIMIEYRNILFFNQAIEFGGHEIMSLKIIKNF